MFESIHFVTKGRAKTTASDPAVLEKLGAIVGVENLIVDPDRVEPYGADAVKKFPRGCGLSRRGRSGGKDPQACE